MPTLEFFGYSQNEIVKLIDTMKPILANLTFCKDIVFVHSVQEQTKVIGWDGLEHPFIRIFTRSKERADLLRGCLKSFEEVIFTTQVALTLNESSRHK